MSKDKHGNFEDIYDNGVDTVTLVDDDGQEYEFELLDFVDYKDKLYAVLLPVIDDQSDGGDDDGVVIMETLFEGNDPVFDFVEDEELAEAVLNEYASRDDNDYGDDDDYGDGDNDGDEEYGNE